VTNSLVGELIYLDKEKTKVGELLKPSGEFFVTFECTGFAKSKVKGSLIGEITPKNTNVGPGQTITHFTLTYEQSSGLQKWKKIEEAGTEFVLMSKLNAGTEHTAGLGSTNEVFPKATTKIEA
jgi:hypothetical protein